ncbi:MAG: helix-turn-helix domain-containing protein [Kiritimatiellales bacterium]
MKLIICMEKHIALCLPPQEVEQLLPAVLDYAGRTGWREVSLIPVILGIYGKFPRTKFDGAILKISTPEMQAAAKKMDCPIINISQALSIADWPLCTFDNYEIGVLAARHLISCGAKTFSMICSAQEFAKYRRQGFTDELHRQGFTLPEENLFSRKELNGKKFRYTILSWPNCVGVFSDSDPGGRLFIQMAEKLGRHIPSEIAVLGCDNMVNICIDCVPALSSIELPEMEVGIAACKLLDRLMRSKKPVPHKTIIKPKQIAVRGSSDVQMLEDPQVTAALQILKTPKGLRMNAEELAQHLMITRRTLDRWFYRSLGRSVADHIRELRLERIKKELAAGNQTVAEIALDVGYQSATHLSKVLQKSTGMCPSDFQKSR